MGGLKPGDARVRNVSNHVGIEGRRTNHIKAKRETRIFLFLYTPRNASQMVNKIRAHVGE